MAIFRRDPLTGASNAGGAWKNRYFRPISGFIACCQQCDRQVWYTQLRPTLASWWHSSLLAISGVVCCSRETDDEVFMTRSLNVTPKTTEQNLIVRSGKSKAEVTIIKDCTWGIVLLKQTTDRHKASRGLSATAELLVLLCIQCFYFCLRYSVFWLSANFSVLDYCKFVFIPFFS